MNAEVKPRAVLEASSRDQGAWSKSSTRLAETGAELRRAGKELKGIHGFTVKAGLGG